MKERPILFRAPMVRAILAGTKTQTRRIVRVPRETPTPTDYASACRDTPGAWWLGAAEHQILIECPYGAPGDRLWVRETWAAFTSPHPEYGDCDEIECAPNDMPELYGTDASDVVYEADGTSFPSRWRPSIHMPRWASRILLEVTAVRVERLQDISEDDARAEGVTPFPVGGEDCWSDGTHRTAFEYLWGEINGHAGEPEARASWAANPWVWVVSFRRVL